MKIAFRLGLVLALILLVLWAISASVSTTATENDFVGSDACKDCHEDQFKNFVPTSHAKLASLSSWKNKVTGCESCHGPGKAYVEEGDPAKIISFKNKSSKQISETCLTCHTGREEHNNFRRGEHWRIDERVWQLQSVSLYGIGGVLWESLSHRNEAGICRVSGGATCETQVR